MALPELRGRVAVQAERLGDHRRGGGARLAWPEEADENQPPPWLVFGGMVRIASVNVNGVRAAFRKGMGEWLEAGAPENEPGGDEPGHPGHDNGRDARFNCRA